MTHDRPQSQKIMHDHPQELGNKLLNEISGAWHPSLEARRVLRLLGADIDRPGWGAVRHAVRSLEILSLFCKTMSDTRRQQMADATLLHDVPGRILHCETDERVDLSDELMAGWHRYIEAVGPDNPVHIYMHDQVTIGEQARAYRESIKQQENGLSRLQKEQINDASYDGMVNTVGWHMDIPQIRSDVLEDVSERVNIESLLIKAAEMLDNLKFPPPHDSQQMRNILEAESFYMPMLEAIGYDAMAAEMASTCHIYRLRGQGKGDVVEKAAKLYEQYAERDPAELAMQVFGLDEPPEIKWIVNETSDDVYSGINCRFAEMTVPIGGKEQRVLFRQKSIGSMANKMAKKGEDYVLMDPFGFQVIVDAGDETLDTKKHYELSDDEISRIHDVQTEGLAACFAEFAPLVLHNPALALRSPRENRKPVFVQGDDPYIQAVMDQLPVSVHQDVGSVVDTRKATPYRVAKMTGLVGDEERQVPVEVQMITELDRKLARTGETSHIAYKNGGNDGLRWIQKIHRRVEYMKSGDGNPIAKELGRVAVQAVLRRLYAALFAPEALLKKK